MKEIIGKSKMKTECLPKSLIVNQLKITDEREIILINITPMLENILLQKSKNLKNLLLHI